MTPPTLVRVVRLDCQRGGEKTKVWDPRIPGHCPKTIKPLPPCNLFPSSPSTYFLTGLPPSPKRNQPITHNPQDTVPSNEKDKRKIKPNNLLKHERGNHKMKRNKLDLT
jgi:hypothetical protein